MSSTHVHQPGIHRTCSTGPAPTPAPLPRWTASTSFPSQPLDVDNIPFSHLVASTLIPAPQNPIPEHASPSCFDVQRELTPGECNFSPERPVSDIRWSFRAGLRQTLSDAYSSQIPPGHAPTIRAPFSLHTLRVFRASLVQQGPEHVWSSPDHIFPPLHLAILRILS
jgi:hypothetical protein